MRFPKQVSYRAANKPAKFYLIWRFLLESREPKGNKGCLRYHYNVTLNFSVHEVSKDVLYIVQNEYLDTLK